MTPSDVTVSGKRSVAYRTSATTMVANVAHIPNEASTGGMALP